ncbi:hypothetical protein [Intrasporangium sp.]|uniref:hypothetical protein n=1 Tax=Intrasporangium sp. TaxID=1925024 RepID=UPI00293A02AD|nr:hypothetical protein [Intrasporangium sp.]MDV3220161.1 hypothetical protein [Intrasporangium sp.]
MTSAPSAGVPATGRDATPGSLPSTTVPAAPAPQAFVDRAKAVASAVRGAGLPTGSDGLVLLHGWTADLAFDTDAQKVAWAAGRVTLAPSVPADQVGVSTMTLPDGSERPVDVIGPQEALARALEDSTGTCAGVPEADCGITLSGASLTTARVATNEGEVTVPAWSLTGDGLSRPIVVVATGPGPLQLLDRDASPPGLPPAGPGLNSADTLDAVSGRAITVQIGHSACDRDLQGHVVEFADLVVVGGTHTPPEPGTMCTAQYLSAPTVLQLEKPLGDRIVVDVLSGRPRLLGVPYS